MNDSPKIPQGQAGGVHAPLSDSPDSPQADVGDQFVWQEAWEQHKDGPIANLSDAQRRTYATGEQKRQQAQQQQEAAKPDLWEATESAVELDWSLNWAFQGAKEYVPDPDYMLDEKEVKDLMGDIPSQHWDMLSEATSRAHAEAIARRAKHDWKNEQQLASMGWTGVGLRVGAALTDPLAWGVGTVAAAATGGVGTVAVAAHKLNRIRRAVKLAAVGGASNLAVEGIIAAEKPIYDNMNLLYAGALGAGIGGVFGALGRSAAAKPELTEIKRLSNQMQRDIESHIKGDSAGAARASRVEELSNDEALDLYDEGTPTAQRDAPRAAMARFRFDLMGRGKASKNSLMRAAYNVMAEDAVGNADKSISTAFGATERQILLQRQNEIRWRRAMESNFKRWSRSRNGGKLSWWKANDDRERFNTEVADYIRGFDREFAPEVKAVGDEARAIFDDYRQRLNQPGAYRGEYRRAVKGAGTLEENPNYLPRVFDMRKVNDLVQEFGDDTLKRFLAEAFQRGTDEFIEDADAIRAADAYLKTVRELKYGINGDASRMLNATDAEELKRILREDTSMDEVDIEDTVDALMVRKQDGTSQHLKHRMQLDETFSANLRSRGGETRTVRFTDLLVNDVEDLMQQYNRRMSGSLAMAEYRVPGLVDGITSRGEWDTFKNKIRAKASEVGQDEASLKAELDGLDFLYNTVMGIPLEGADSAYAQTLKQFRDYNFSRLMGQVGFAQIPEFGVVASALGFKTMLQSMPGFRALWRNAQTGELGTEIANELEMLTGVGGDWLRGTVIHRWDDIAGTPDTFLGNSPTMQRIERFNHVARRGVYAGSGMSTVNTILQRWTLNGIAHKFSKMANGKTAVNADRMRTLGIDESQQEAIFQAIRDHAQYDAKGRLTSMNLKQWDLATAADFQNALFRYSRRVVQENDPGMMMQWMAKPTAQTLMQFKSFIVGAYTKNMMHAFHMRDFETFVSFTAQSFLAGTAYIAQTYLRSVGRDDQSEYLERKLSIQDVAKASFSRAGWASIMPTAIDTGLLVTGQNRQFGYRSSGQSMDIIFGNPTGDLWRNFEESAGGAINSLTDGRALSQEEIQKFTRLLPFQNLMGITQATGLLLNASGLPKNAPTER